MYSDFVNLGSDVLESSSLSVTMDALLGQGGRVARVAEILVPTVEGELEENTIKDDFEEGGERGLSNK